MNEFPTLAALKVEAEPTIAHEQIESIVMTHLPKLAEKVKAALVAKEVSTEYSFDYSDLSAMQHTYGEKFFAQQREVYEALAKHLEGKGFSSVEVQELPKGTGGYYNDTQQYSLRLTWR